ncbi:smoothelin-like protein 1 [Drosophila bipectinata]|uniref:smoothelin-like protein 1 n=1 Tax=Drosophila bipectinata TaxID=42026 RepID=UPI001C88F0EB|nr:nucleolar protein dao-5 [Drosophila bipectinata]
MLSKMAQPNSAGGGGSGGGGAGAGPSGPGRRLPLSLSGGSAVSRIQSGTNGRSNSPQNGGNQKVNATAPLGAVKKPHNHTRSSSSSSASSSASKDEDKKSQNGVSKSTNGKEKPPQNGKDQKESKPKDKASDKVEKEVVTEKQGPAEKNETAEESKKEAIASEVPKPEDKADVVIILDDEPQEAEKAPEPSTPTKERKSTRKSGSQQTSPVAKQPSVSPAQKKSVDVTPTKVAEPSPPAQPEDVEMEPLTVDASPIRSVRSNLDAQPAATSTPGRSIFGFRSGSKQSTEVELAAQASSSPVTAPPRTFAQISGRRSIRGLNTLTPSKVGSYRCAPSDLDTSNCTNASMNATVGSEIPNSSSFSFSIFRSGRKRDRTPPVLSGSQSTNDLAQDVEMSPPKRARFDIFHLNLPSPFSLLRARFSKTTISNPTRLCLDQAPFADDGGEVQNVSGIVIEEEAKLNTSSVSLPEGAEEKGQEVVKDLSVGQEAGVETPKKGGSPVKEIPAEKGVDGNDEEVPVNEENIPPVVESADTETNRSRCSIM